MRQTLLAKLLHVAHEVGVLFLQQHGQLRLNKPLQLQLLFFLWRHDLIRHQRARQLWVQRQQRAGTRRTWELWHGHCVVDHFNVHVVPDEVRGCVLSGFLGADDFLEFYSACVLATVEIDINDFAKLLEKVTDTLDFEFIMRYVFDENREALRVQLAVYLRVLLKQVK